jgi:transposase
VQVVIALIVTPNVLPLAYEAMDGNTSDKKTLKAFLAKREAQYGAAKRTRIVDRDSPTEEVLVEPRAPVTPIHYVVGAPRTAEQAGKGAGVEALGRHARARSSGSNT